MNRLISSGVTVALSLLIVACSSPHTLDVRVSQSNYKDVEIASSTPNEPLRMWANEAPDFLYSAHNQTTPIKVEGEQLNILALSGGGVNGAYGAGVLMGLQEKGELKDYAIITGVSAGALIAPFVFIGGDAMPKMKEVMLNINDKNILGKKNFLNTLFKDAFTDGESLYDFIADAYPEPMIEAMAQQHRNGKRLFIGSTHFDSGELVIWNIGAIANSDLADKSELIYKVLAASASIPGVFPPQFIDVEHDGETLEELHVDGGLAAQVFFNPSNFNYQQISDALGLEKAPQLDVIRNGALKAPYRPLKDKGLDLVSKSVSSLTLAQTRGDLYRMKYISEINDIEMQFTYIDQDFRYAKVTKDMFDHRYLLTIYEYGFKKATQGQLWVTELP
ncbi:MULTISPECIES: patatin-like phospholipase family protein [Vibrio]|uniref:patatin-like phospholipase family protein n=1 Tax=Vibrio TaxID=662 RepID=UPI001BD22DA2|nr:MULTISPECIES: patatin-like phospholipase family protein [Vibrio]MBS9893659.1 patatin-like phospholipase family protein [Vibrio alginolyticus]MDW2093542.1 patatin-like phospholipase family protein [Vibrio sp. 1866]MDW3103063.1 patatin-like phospholipase family protein [Vibrio sp. 1874]MDW3200912.1 patatin-like phospholipase family protein [Vibrio sp. 1865]